MPTFTYLIELGTWVDELHFRQGNTHWPSNNRYSLYFKSGIPAKMILVQLWRSNRIFNAQMLATMTPVFISEMGNSCAHYLTTRDNLKKYWQTTHLADSTTQARMPWEAEWVHKYPSADSWKFWRIRLHCSSGQADRNCWSTSSPTIWKV